MLKELYDEPISDEDFQQLVEKQADQLAITEIRKLLIRLRQIDRERSTVKGIRDAVLHEYNDTINRYDRHEQLVRNSLYGFVLRHGTTSFPDVGTAYLRRQKPKIDVADAVKAKAWAKKNGYVKEEPDITAAKAGLLKTGELPGPESGFEFVPETETLAVRT